MIFKEALDIKPGDVISLVGGGGKTTLMFALARELASNTGCVVTTTTTKIFEPLPSETPLLLLETNGQEMIRLLLQNMDKYQHITLATERLASGKLNGIGSELVIKLAELNQVSYLIVEADGAAHKSLKAPNPTEPVIPRSTTLVIPVVGIDALGCQLNEENVFRPNIVSKLTGLALGKIITADVIATMVTHPEGIAKGSPARARIIPFLNKMDLDDGLPRGRTLAAKILEKRHPQISKVILGQVQAAEPVVQIISAPNQ